MATPELDKLIQALERLPGLGRRSSERIAIALLRKPDTLLDGLRDALSLARDSVCTCSLCGAFTSHAADPCPLCTRTGRDASILCVVEEPADIVGIENSGAFNGRYHALMGKLSPAKRLGVADLRMDLLFQRLTEEPIKELLLALSTDIEGDMTAAFIAERLQGTDIKVTRLAFGLPAGSAVAYSDPITLKRAIQGRQSAL